MTSSHIKKHKHYIQLQKSYLLCICIEIHKNTQSQSKERTPHCTTTISRGSLRKFKAQWSKSAGSLASTQTQIVLWWKMWIALATKANTSTCILVWSTVQQEDKQKHSDFSKLNQNQVKELYSFYLPNWIILFQKTYVLVHWNNATHVNSTGPRHNRHIFRKKTALNQQANKVFLGTTRCSSRTNSALTLVNWLSLTSVFSKQISQKTFAE